MKKFFILTLLLTGYLHVRSQQFLRPSFGAGYGIAVHHGLSNPPGTAKSGIFCYNPELSIVEKFDNWFVSVGISYLTTGYSFKVASLTLQGSQTPLINAKLNYEYRHVTLPLSFGYQAKLKKLVVIPEAGVDLAYNLGLKSTLTSAEYKSALYSQREQFSQIHNDLSVFGSLRLSVGYPLGKRVMIAGGPVFKSMLTNFVHKKAIPVPDAMQKNHVVLLNVGVYIGLSQQNPPGH